MENPALRNGHTEYESRTLHMGVCFTKFSQVKFHCLSLPEFDFRLIVALIVANSFVPYTYLLLISLVFRSLYMEIRRSSPWPKRSMMSWSRRRRTSWSRSRRPSRAAPPLSTLRYSRPTSSYSMTKRKKLAFETVFHKLGWVDIVLGPVSRFAQAESDSP